MWTSLVAAVVFLLSSHPAEACTCIAMHLQIDYCRSDLIIKGKFLSITSPEEQMSKTMTPEGATIPPGGTTIPPFDAINPPWGEWDAYNTYSVEILEVFQGAPVHKDLKFKSYRMVCPLYLPPNAMNTEYLITGSLNNGEVWLGYCNYVVPWSEVSDEEILGIQGAYSKGCSCKITTKYTGFSPSSRCLQEAYGPLGSTQDKFQRCVPISEDTCIWEDIPV